MKVLFIASSGGHWIQLCRLRSAAARHEAIFACTNRENAGRVPGCRYYSLPDASMSQKLRLVYQALCVLWLLLRVRPGVIVSTGASVGFFALLLGKLLGVRTVWVDSVANAEEMSLSGKKAKKYADLYLTQWEHLATPETGAKWFGAVL